MILAELTDLKILKQRLQLGGLRASVITEKAALFMQNADMLIQSGLDRQAEAMAYFVPGRIEVLGKHTDYAGGRSIVAAVERGFCAVATVRNDNLMRIWDTAKNNYLEFKLNSSIKIERGNWCNYPQTAARRIVNNFSCPLQGVDMAFSSDLPIASGMSSSSAMIVMFFLILSQVNHLERQNIYQENIRNKLDLAGYLAAIENGQNFGSLKGNKGVGTFGGSEDHTAILCSQSDRLGQFAYHPIRLEQYIPVPAGYTFAFGSSGVQAPKTGSAQEKYNRLSSLAAEITKIWRQEKGYMDEHLGAVIARGPGAMKELHKLLTENRIDTFTPAELKRYWDHFIAENEEIIKPAAVALAEGNLIAFGELVDRSQTLSATHLDNQVAETNYLAQNARELGAAAASSFGAGFGGSVWAMIKEKNASSFLDKWSASYKKVFLHRASEASFFLSKAGPATFMIN